MKRYINPLFILSMLLCVGSLMLVPTNTVEAQSGVAWTGLFFPSTDFTGSSQVVSYPSGLSQSWGTGSPTNPNTGTVLAGIPADNFSARFSTNTTIETGTYEFIVVADGGVRLTINGEVLINDLSNTGQKQYSVIVTVTTGSYLIILDYIEFTENALIQITWALSDGTSTTGTQTPTVAIGEVVYVRGLSLRSGPFLGATLRGIARPGVSYPIIAQNTEEGLFTWYLIQFDVDTQGWVSGRYFAITEGTSESIPIQAATAFTTVYNPPGTVTGISRSNMNFRTLPTERAPRIAEVPQLDWGAQFEILARTRQGGEDFWYQIRYTPTNSTTSYVGWVFAPYIGFVLGSDPIDTVPSL